LDRLGITSSLPLLIITQTLQDQLKGFPFLPQNECNFSRLPFTFSHFQLAVDLFRENFFPLLDKDNCGSSTRTAGSNLYTFIIELFDWEIVKIKRERMEKVKLDGHSPKVKPHIGGCYMAMWL